MRPSAFSLIAALVLLTAASSAVAQPAVWSVPINETGLDVRGAPVVLEEIGIRVDEPGRVVVRIDGHAYADSGDRLVLAASDTPGWAPNDGAVGIESVDSFIGLGGFSHTRAYDVTPGHHVFYAVAQNYVELEGSGQASIYGSLTVKYFPDRVDGSFAQHQGIQSVSTDFRGAPVVLAQETINTNAPGRVRVRFDGSAIATPGDRIILAASETSSWNTNDGHVAVEILDADLNRHCFSHSRSYDVAAGSHTFYAVGENYVEEDGTGTASVYGSLTVEFHPDQAGTPEVHHVGFTVNPDLRGAPVSLASIDLASPGPGTAVVQFDGICISQPGDMIILAASDAVDWSPNDGNVGVESPNSTADQHSFAHTRAYSVGAGTHTFHAVGENYVHQSGPGTAWIYGNLTVEYFPDGSSAVPTRVESSSVRALDGCNEIRWRLSGEVASRFRVLREEIASGVQTVLSDHTIHRDGTDHVCRDESARPGVEVLYRVIEETGRGSLLLFASEPVVTRAPSGLSLACAPNPFNPTTRIRFSLPGPAVVTLGVYDSAGRRVRTLLAAREFSSGVHDVPFDGRDERGARLASGSYMVRLATEDAVRTRRLSLVK